MAQTTSRLGDRSPSRARGSRDLATVGPSRLRRHLEASPTPEMAVSLASKRLGRNGIHVPMPHGDRSPVGAMRRYPSLSTVWATTLPAGLAGSTLRRTHQRPRPTISNSTPSGMASEAAHTTSRISTRARSPLIATPVSLRRCDRATVLRPRRRNIRSCRGPRSFAPGGAVGLGHAPSTRAASRSSEA
jgi:hypothetical protein